MSVGFNVILCLFQGALVPLSDEVLEHLKIEGCGILAERLSLSSGATVKMINGKFCGCSWPYLRCCFITFES